MPPRAQHDDSATMTSAPVDRHVFLAGRPPLGEYLGFLSNMAVNGEASDVATLSDEWRDANDHIRQLERDEAGLPDGVEIGALPPELDQLQARVLADPIYKRSFSVVPASIGVVELDRLVVFQKHINLDYVETIKSSLGPAPDVKRVFTCCLPFDHPRPPVRGLPAGNNAYVFISPSTDLRFLEPTLLEEAQIGDYQPRGPVASVVGLMVGFGSNFLNVVAADGRLVLNNGSHRAYALRDLGITSAPCIVQHVSRIDELEVTAPRLLPNPEIYLKAARPPLLKDYFDPRLRKVISVPRRLRQVRVTFQVETIDVPATA